MLLDGCFEGDFFRHTTFCDIAQDHQFTSGLTGIDITGYTNPIWGNSTAMPWIRFETNWNLVNNWTKIVGNHTLKFGFDGRLNRDGLLTTNIYSVRGQYRFRAGQTSLNGDSRNGRRIFCLS